MRAQTSSLDRARSGTKTSHAARKVFRCSNRPIVAAPSCFALVRRATEKFAFT